MKNHKQLKLIIILCLTSLTLFSQNIKTDTIQKKKNSTFNYKSLIIPTVLIGYGVVDLENDGLKFINSKIREEVIENIDSKFTIDDISQYVPFISVYGLNAIGIKGKNNFKDRTIILGTAYLIMGTTVTATKKITAIERPDGSNFNSFPSGHTATAFMGAEFLYQEYKDVSIWYGISGYLVATGTGFFRMYNNKHWLTDVAAGAGIGILSTKIAYWIHPFIKRTIFKDKEKSTGMLLPFYNGKEAGLSITLLF
ncbi:MAG TPA: phosphatase PAP2 family protein [Bacteroidetes bacterium]|nr:phosphatase PAP2 family protein [Bacteroidota bacterium]